MPKSFGRPKIGTCTSNDVPQYIVPPSASCVVPMRQVARPDAGGLEAAHQFGPIWKWSSMRMVLLPQPAM